MIPLPASKSMKSCNMVIARIIKLIVPKPTLPSFLVRTMSINRLNAAFSILVPVVPNILFIILTIIAKINNIAMRYFVIFVPYNVTFFVK